MILGYFVTIIFHILVAVVTKKEEAEVVEDTMVGVVVVLVLMQLVGVVVALISMNQWYGFLDHISHIEIRYRKNLRHQVLYPLHIIL